MVEEFSVRLLVTEQVGQEEVIDIVELFGFLLDEIQVLGVLHWAGFAVHEQVDLDLVDHWDEVDEGVMDLAAGFLTDLLTLVQQFLLLLQVLSFVALVFTDDVCLYLFPEIEDALEVFNQC